MSAAADCSYEAPALSIPSRNGKKMDFAFLLRWRIATSSDNIYAWQDLKAELSAEVHAALEALEYMSDSNCLYQPIMNYSFLHSRIQQHPAYGSFLCAVLAEPCLAVADIGAAFGQESRRLILDGLPRHRLVVGDVGPAYWEAGLRIFDKSCLLAWQADQREALPEVTAKVGRDSYVPGTKFIWGDWASALEGTVGKVGENDLAADIQGQLCGAILMMVLHCLSAHQQVCILSRLACCLRPGGMLLGSCLGCPSLASSDSLATLLHDVGFEGEIVVVRKPESSPAKKQVTDLGSSVKLRFYFSAIR